VSSKITGSLITYGLLYVVSVIRQGKPVATISGGILGAALGAASALTGVMSLVPFCIAVGALSGAFILAAIFKQPPIVPWARETDLEPFRFGPYRKRWIAGDENWQCMVAMHENAIYLLWGDLLKWKEVVEKLTRAEDPGHPHGDWIRIDELLGIQMSSPGSKEVQLLQAFAAKVTRHNCIFETVEDRQEFIALIEERLGSTFRTSEENLDFVRSVRLPLALLAAGCLLVALVAGLTAHLTANPPPIPRGKLEQDSVVQFLTWAGVTRILLLGTILNLPVLCWLVSRIVSPPRLITLRTSNKQSI
jgi:hypothetical protein